MQSKFNQLVGKSFVYKSKFYEVLDVKDVFGKIAIITNGRTFSKLENDFDEFMNEIDFRDLSNLEKKESWIPSTNEFVKKDHVHHAEIMKANDLSGRMTEKLEAVFDEISNNPSEEIYKKASAMVAASNAIVNVQMANYKYLTLK
jgi:hypothetical protein